MIFRVLGGVAALIAVVAAIVLLGQTDRATDEAMTEDSRTVNPGYSARDAVIIETGEDGRPRYRLQAETIRQQPNDLTVSLANMALEYVGDDGTLWNASADRGVVPQSGDRIDLAGDVLLTGVLDGAEVPARIETERLALDTRTEIATTDAPVTITWAGKRITSQGLTANLQSQTLRLESEVHGSYSP